MVKGLVTIIIRFHSTGNIDLLKDALFSVALQSYEKIEVITALHNCSNEQISMITNYIQDLSFTKNIPENLKLFNIVSPKDIRSKLLNEGIRRSTGEYLCFLDYDDVLYNNAFEFHVSMLKDSPCALNAGGCRVSHSDMLSGEYPYTILKKRFQDHPFSLINQINTNTLPIHSFMLHRKKIKKADLVFNERLEALEDYDLLLRLMAKYEFNFAYSNTPVCEYRIRNDQTHTTPFHDTQSMSKDKKWSNGRNHIAKLKKEMKFNQSYEAILRMSKGHA